ncbi:MAG: hypothetical protein ACOYON_12725 [Fimbriimonas sp.]
MSVWIASLVLATAPRTIEFSGYKWQVKAGTSQMGPGPNWWSDDAKSVWVDAKGALHMTVRNINGRWHSTEVYLEKSLGYGTYRFEVASPANAVPNNVVLGLFTWSNPDEDNHREIDFEISRWGDPKAANAQFVVQPYDRPGQMVRFEIDPASPSVHEFVWKPGSVAFTCSRPDGRQFATWSLAGAMIPKSVDEAVHINLWQFEGKVPSTGKPVEVVIKRFHFKPL